MDFLVESAVAVLAFGFGGHKLGHIFLIYVTRRCSSLNSSPSVL